jgi:hypothetical protein
MVHMGEGMDLLVKVCERKVSQGKVSRHRRQICQRTGMHTRII